VASAQAGRADKAAITALFADAEPDLLIEKLPDEDWVTLSQAGVEPIDEGPFHVHTPEYPPRAKPASATS
jgi:ribosomal protein L11 methyltransferase